MKFDSFLDKKTIPNSISNLKHLKNELEELSLMEFYRYLFPVGSFENRGQTSDLKPNGILIHGSKGNMKKMLVFDDLKEIQDIAKSKEDCFISPVGYIGRTHKKVNARKLYALAFDIDYLRLREGDRGNYYCGVHKFLECMFEGGIYYYTVPKPNLISMSSEGHLHLYYVLEEPMDCYKENMDQLSKIKNGITSGFWRSEFIDIKNYPTQYESLTQSFRIVGSKNQKHGNIIHGFIYEKTKYKNIEHLMQCFKTERAKYLPAVAKAHYNFKLYVPPSKPNKKQNFDSTKTCWKIKPDLYNWYFKYLMSEEAKEGSRYWRCFVLCSVAYKCRIPKNQLIKDLKVLLEFEQNAPNQTTPFTWDDAKASLKSYCPDYTKVSIEFVNKHCRIDKKIEKAKRNYRDQDTHLKMARFMKSLDPNLKGGRPTKKDIIKERRANNPNSSKYECRKELNIDKKTIRKWWDCE